MKHILSTFGAVLLAGILLTSCSKDKSTGSGNLTYKLKSQNFTASVGALASGSGLSVDVNSKSSLNWTSGILNISEIDFEAENSNNEIEFELKKPFSVNLMNAIAMLGSIHIPDGTYDEVEINLELKPSAGNVPLSLKGTYTNSAGNKIPVELIVNEDIEIEIEAEDVTFSASQDYTALINLELNKLLLNISSSDLDQAVKTNGSIIISNTSNKNLYGKLKSNFELFGHAEFED